MERRVAIAGGGVAGLATAIALRQQGVHVRIVERNPGTAGAGLGFLLMPNGLAALARLGLSEEVIRRGTLVSRRSDVVVGAGTTTRRIEPHLCIARADLLDVLSAAAGAVVDTATVTGVGHDTRGQVDGLLLDDGRAVPGDIVVGADGGASVVRQSLFGPGPTARPVLAEIIARVRAAAVARWLGARLLKIRQPEGRRWFGIAPAASDEVYWYLQWPARLGLPDATDADGLARFVEQHLDGWPDPVPALWAATDFRQALVIASGDREPPPALVADGAVLVGDAGHLLLPLSTQGASSALEDAVTLADCLREQPSPPEALAAFNRRRLPAARRHLHLGRRRLRMLDSRPRPPPSFDDDQIDRELLRQRAFNHRWAMVPDDVIPLTAADHDFPLAAPIRDAVTAYVARGPLSYGPPEGLPAYRAAVADVVRGRRGAPCTADGVLATDSAAAAMFLVARWALQPGDEAVVFDPVDYLFVASAEAAGATVVRCPLEPRTGRVDPDRLRSAITSRTRLIGVCNPHNPLGHVLDADELELLGRLAVDHGLWLLNDEVWADVVFPPAELISLPSIDDAVAARTITVGGFSKAFGLAGLRIGYVATSAPDVRDGLFDASMAASTATGAATLSQVAAQAAYEDAWDWFGHFLAHLRIVRDHAVSRLNAVDGVTCASPEATFVLFPDIRSFGQPSEKLAEHILEAGRLAVVPGSPRWFGPAAEGHLRVSFATSMAVVDEGLDRLERALAVV